MRHDLAAKIWLPPLACRKVHGIGPKASAQLTQLGIHDIGALARCERAWLMQQFGRSNGAWMHEAAWGRDDRPVVADSEPVSLSRETTFERDLHAMHDRAQLRLEFIALCVDMRRDLQRHACYAGRTIGRVKLRYADTFVRQTRDQDHRIPDQRRGDHPFGGGAGSAPRRAHAAPAAAGGQGERPGPSRNGRGRARSRSVSACSRSAGIAPALGTAQPRRHGRWLLTA